MATWLRIVVAVGLIALLLWRFDWNEFWPTIEQIRPATIAVIFVLLVLQMPICAWKWQYSLQLHDRRFGFGYLLQTICIGFFFNNFLPSAIGGDAYRIYRTLPTEGRKGDAISAVLLDRVVGLGALLFLGLLGALFLFNDYLLARLYVLAVVSGGIAFCLLLAAIYFGYFKFATTRLRRYAWFAAIDRVWDDVLVPRPGWIGFVFASFLFQASAAAIIYFLFDGLGQHVSPAASTLISASAGLASVLPISINGIGVVEGSIAGSATALGVTFNIALTAAVLLRILILPLSAACGVVYLLSREGKKVPIVSQ